MPLGSLVLGLLLGEQVLLQQDAELLAQGLELVEVLLVLLLVLDLGLDTCCVLTVVSQSFRSRKVSVRGPGARPRCHPFLVDSQW